MTPHSLYTKAKKLQNNYSPINHSKPSECAEVFNVDYLNTGLLVYFYSQKDASLKVVRIQTIDLTSQDFNNFIS